MSSSRLLAFVCLFVLFLIQNALVYVFPSKAPALVLIGVLFFALTEGRSFGAFAGMWGGLLMDLYGLGRPGFTMAAYALVGFSSGFVSSKIFQDSWLAEIVLPFASLYAVMLAELALMRSQIGDPAGPAALAESFRPWPLFTTVLAAPWLFSRLRRIWPRRRRRWAPVH